MNTRHDQASNNPVNNEESLLRLFSQLISALLHIGVAKIPHRVRHSTITLCGMICLFTPLLLWIAWSKLLLYALLYAFIGAIVILYLLITFSPDEFF